MINEGIFFFYIAFTQKDKNEWSYVSISLVIKSKFYEYPFNKNMNKGNENPYTVDPS